jgi:CDGSH-type Zn-finger protein
MATGFPRKLLVNPCFVGHRRETYAAMTSTITPYEDGPLIIRGDFEMRTPDGALIEPGRATVALCRCGKSAVKPFCDGTHKVINFKAAADRDTPSPRRPD